VNALFAWRSVLNIEIAGEIFPFTFLKNHIKSYLASGHFTPFMACLLDLRGRSNSVLRRNCPSGSLMVDGPCLERILGASRWHNHGAIIRSRRSATLG
jgi:hypothetical protein